LHVGNQELRKQFNVNNPAQAEGAARGVRQTAADSALCAPSPPVGRGAGGRGRYGLTRNRITKLHRA
jgi:hypothetical protein